MSQRLIVVSALPGKRGRYVSSDCIARWEFGFGVTGYYDRVAIAGKLHGFDSAIVA